MIGSWTDVCRFRTFQPGPDDAFVVVFVNGRYATFRPTADHGRLADECAKLARAHQTPIKLLPMQPAELFNLLNIRREHWADTTPWTEQDRQMAVSTCREALIECDDRSVRKQAHRLLTALEERL